MCDLICDVIICRVWSCDMGNNNVYDKIMIENQKQGENMEIREIFTCLHLIDGLGIEFTACWVDLIPEEVSDIIYRMRRISLLCRSGKVIDVKK